MAEASARLGVEHLVTPATVDAGQQAIADAERELGDRPIRQYPESWRRTLALAMLERTALQVVAAERARAGAVTRFEAIDETGRLLTMYDVAVELSYQDDDRTLKVFLKRRKASP